MDARNIVPEKYYSIYKKSTSRISKTKKQISFLKKNFGTSIVSVFLPFTKILLVAFIVWTICVYKKNFVYYSKLTKINSIDPFLISIIKRKIKF